MCHCNMFHRPPLDNGMFVGQQEPHVVFVQQSDWFRIVAGGDCGRMLERSFIQISFFNRKIEFYILDTFTNL